MSRSDPASVAAPPKTIAVWKRYLPLAALAAVLAVVFLNGWHKVLSLENVAIYHSRFQGFIQNNTLLALLAYIATYAAAVALSLPGALILTLSGGLIFGGLLGGTAAVIGASSGAVLLFLIARSAFGETLRAKAGPQIARMVDGFKSDALSYLLFLRLVPAFPFFIVNVAAALIGVPLRTYVIGTVLGIIPATFAFASVGAGLESIIATARRDQLSCMLTNKIPGGCPFELSAKSLITKEILIALSLLAVVALIPVVMKKWKARHG